MKKFFNIAGPCDPGKHYMLPASARLSNIQSLIDQELYFVIHAARQSGKTTLLSELEQTLNAEGRYYALYCSLESVQGIAAAERGIPAIIRSFRVAVQCHPALKTTPFANDVDWSDFNNALRVVLFEFCALLDKPLVVLFDETDCLSNGTLITFLRQLREGYINRVRVPFVHSLALVGMRNIRDYKGEIREERRTLGSVSPFNIVTKAMTLRNFTLDEIKQLYHQHTAATGQAFNDEVIARAYHYTQGQPWLVNALVREVVVELLEGDEQQPITVGHIDQAAQNIMLRRDTHIDSLLERLKEERVQKIIEPVLLGQTEGIDRYSDDMQYVLDLGLLRNNQGELSPANTIYREVIVRALSYNTQYALPLTLQNQWMTRKTLDMNGLLKAFQQFWRENSDVWIERYQYKEAAPHLIVMAFLQRVLNGGGQITREFASGRKRLDLCVEYAGKKYPIELKLYYTGKTRDEGIRQLISYMDTLGTKEGWLLIFDRRSERTWEEKMTWDTVEENGKTIHVIGG